MKKIPLWIAIPIAVISGFLLSASFPSASIWFLAIIAVAGFGFSLLGRNMWTAFLVGTIFGTTFWLSLINWLTLYLGPVPWLALGLLQALFIGLSAIFIAQVLNKGPQKVNNQVWQVFGVSAVASALWVLRELMTSVWPYGGFSWGKLAQSQAESPLVHAVSWVGNAGLSFLIALMGFLVVQSVRSQKKPMLLVPFLVAVIVLAIPAFSVDTTGTVTVLAVQGNSKAGLFDNASPGEIMSDHVSGTLKHQGESVDLVLWPENAADIDPLRSEQSAAILTEVSSVMEAPILTGTITHPSEEEFYNSSVLWADSWQAQYDKIHPVPFAEYMPDRAFWRSLQPELVDLVSRNYSFGTRPNVINIDGVPMGVSICFDITDDAQIRQMIGDGAEVILAQTNNADFGKTSENLQQLAIARLQAIETGRSVVNISTVGTSAVINQQGQTIDSIPAYQSGEMLTQVPLSKTVTPAMSFGWFIQILIAAIGLLGLLFILWRRKF